MAISEIITDWQAENTAGGLSVMYFDGAGGEATIRAAIDTMFTAMANKIDSLTTWTVRTEGKIIDEATGTLTGFWNDSTAATGVGTLSGSPVANASQALLRWRTNEIVNGRLLQGRTFVPGLGSGATDGGQLAAATVTQFQAAQTAFLATGSVDMVIWHRPLGGSPGSAGLVVSGATWAEMATLRPRR